MYYLQYTAPEKVEDPRVVNEDEEVIKDRPQNRNQGRKENKSEKKAVKSDRSAGKETEESDSSANFRHLTHILKTSKNGASRLNHRS